MVNIKSSPLKMSTPPPCNKSRITVCINSLHLRWGMEIRIGGNLPQDDNGEDMHVYIEYITYDGGAGDITASITLSENIDSQLTVGGTVTFHGDRGLNFHKDRKITGINIIDGMLFWTDNHSEPKKVNIERSKEGSKSWKYGAGWDGSLASPSPKLWDNCTGGGGVACYSDFDQHTKLIVTDNHVMECEKSTLSCPVYGCTNGLASNYNPLATVDDGTCILPPPTVYGCDDGTLSVGAFNNVNACNSGLDHWSGSATGNPDGDYNTNDSDLCIFPDECEICDNNPSSGTYGQTIVDPICAGCTDPAATNYDPNATVDDGSCTYAQVSWNCENPGNNTCVDPGDGSGTYTDANSGGNIGDGLAACQAACVIVVNTYGCTDPNACGYDPLATIDDGSCSPFGCTDPGATNYNANVTSNCDDGSCIFNEPIVTGCIDPYAKNYNGPGHQFTHGTQLMIEANTMCNDDDGDGIPDCCCYTGQCNGGYTNTTTANPMPQVPPFPAANSFDVMNIKVGAGHHTSIASWMDDWPNMHNGDSFPNIFTTMKNNSTYYPSMSTWKGWSFEYAPGPPNEYIGMDPNLITSMSSAGWDPANYQSPVIAPHINNNGNLVMGFRANASNVNDIPYGRPFGAGVGVYFDASGLPDFSTSGYEVGYDVVVTFERISGVSDGTNPLFDASAGVWGPSFHGWGPYSNDHVKIGVGFKDTQLTSMRTGLGTPAGWFNHPGRYVDSEINGIKYMKNDDMNDGVGPRGRYLYYESLNFSGSAGETINKQVFGGASSNSDVWDPIYNSYASAYDKRPKYPFKAVQMIKTPPASDANAIIGGGYPPGWWPATPMAPDEGKLFLLWMYLPQNAIKTSWPHRHGTIEVEISDIRIVRRKKNEQDVQGYHVQNGLL